VKYSGDYMKMKMKGGMMVEGKRDETAIEAAAREAKNAYLREWRAKNPDKVKKHLKI
jgi:5S rRNA maturation endonuclease (ribonuclease M5)